MASDAQLGKIVLAAAIITFLYYFFWISILPFMLIDEGNLIHSFFPSLEYAFIVPVAFGVIFLGGIALFTLYHLWNFIQAKKTNKIVGSFYNKRSYQRERQAASLAQQQKS